MNFGVGAEYQNVKVNCSNTLCYVVYLYLKGNSAAWPRSNADRFVLFSPIPPPAHKRAICFYCSFRSCLRSRALLIDSINWYAFKMVKCHLTDCTNYQHICTYVHSWHSSVICTARCCTVSQITVTASGHSLVNCRLGAATAFDICFLIEFMCVWVCRYLCRNLCYWT